MISMILIVLLIHYISDFILQPEECGKNKWHSLSHLCTHIVQYGLCMSIGLGIIVYASGISITSIMTYLFIQITSHFGIDYLTSKWSHALYESKQTKGFWIVIGLDQLAHQFFLIYYIQILTGT